LATIGSTRKTKAALIKTVTTNSAWLNANLEAAGPRAASHLCAMLPIED
jgi:hypothetical protein